jgi:hypothetical protein
VQQSPRTDGAAYRSSGRNMSEWVFCELSRGLSPGVGLAAVAGRGRARVRRGCRG